MATVSNKRPKPSDPATQPRAKPTKPPRSGGMGRRLVMAAMLAVGLWFAPALAGRTSLGDWPLRQALPGINGTITSGGRTFGWLSPIEYRDVQIHDASGNVLATVAVIRTEKSLAQLASHPSDLGTIRIEQLQATIELRRDGSNLEDVLQPWDSRSTSGAKPTLDLELTDGHVELHDVAVDQRWKIESVSLALRLTPASSLPTEFSIAGTVATDSGPKKFKIAYRADGAASNRAAVTNVAATNVAPSSGAPPNSAVTHDATPTSPGPEVELQSDPLPLAMFRGVLARALPEAQLAGQLSANLQFLPGGTGSANRLQGDIQASDFTLTATPLGTDQVHFAQLHVPCKLSWQASQLDVEQLAVTCDAGDVQLIGQIPLPLNSAASLTDWLSQTYTVQGQIDLAKLAKLLPATLHVRPGTQVTSGQVKLAIESTAADAGHHWNAQFSADKLTATEGTHQLSLLQPITATAAILAGPGGLTIEKLDCQSSFLHVSGSGTSNQFAFDATYDLKQLGAELGQFLALDDLQLAGDGRSQIHWQRAADGSYQATTSSELHNVHAWLWDWFIDEPIAKLDAAGTWNPTARRLQLGPTTLLSSTVSLHTDGATVDWPAEGFPGWTGLSQARPIWRGL
jgi:hypothetical protein